MSSPRGHTCGPTPAYCEGPGLSVLPLSCCLDVPLPAWRVVVLGVPCCPGHAACVQNGGRDPFLCVARSREQVSCRVWFPWVCMWDVTLLRTGMGDGAWLGQCGDRAPKHGRSRAQTCPTVGGSGRGDPQDAVPCWGCAGHTGGHGAAETLWNSEPASP